MQTSRWLVLSQLAVAGGSADPWRRPHFHVQSRPDHQQCELGVYETSGSRIVKLSSRHIETVINRCESEFAQLVEYVTIQGSLATQ